MAAQQAWRRPVLKVSGSSPIDNKKPQLLLSGHPSGALGQGKPSPYRRVPFHFSVSDGQRAQPDPCVFKDCDASAFEVYRKVGEICQQ